MLRNGPPPERDVCSAVEAEPRPAWTLVEHLGLGIACGHPTYVPNPILRATQWSKPLRHQAVPMEPARVNPMERKILFRPGHPSRNRHRSCLPRVKEACFGASA